MIQQKVWRVAAFAEGTLEGNPAGVVILPDEEPWPGDGALQALAAEVGYSETAYVKREGDGKFRLRWFTPKVEVDLCGHATLAAAFTLWETQAVDTPTITFASLSGDLPTSRDISTGRIALDFPLDSPIQDAEPENLRAPLAAALGISLDLIVDLFRGRLDVMVLVADERTVFQCTPDMDALEKLDTRGTAITAPAAPASIADFTSRYFAPRCGVPEDPVTGSAHCLLGPYWARRLRKGQLVGYQASDRGGLVHVAIRPDSNRVSLSGHANFID